MTGDFQKEAEVRAEALKRIIQCGVPEFIAGRYVARLAEGRGIVIWNQGVHLHVVVCKKLDLEDAFE